MLTIILSTIGLVTGILIGCASCYKHMKKKGYSTANKDELLIDEYEKIVGRQFETTKGFKEIIIKKDEIIDNKQTIIQDLQKNLERAISEKADMQVDLMKLANEHHRILFKQELTYDSPN